MRNYEQLEKLYAEYKPQGLEILAFPCNQFLKQEPGSDGEIKARVSTKWANTFPMFSKVNVNGPDVCEVYRFLRSATLKNQPPGKEIEWNFAKFLVGRDGQVTRRYGPDVDPETFNQPDRLPAWLTSDEATAESSEPPADRL